jgi:hypothetical protein
MIFAGIGMFAVIAAAIALAALFAHWLINRL